MSGVVETLKREAWHGAGAVESILQQHEFPLIEGRTATFVWRGQASHVALRHWIHSLPSSQDFEHLHGTDLWLLTMDIPEGSRVEYKIEVARGHHRELVRDPLNPHTARDPFGANSVVHGAGYEEPSWACEDPEARKGELVDFAIDSQAFGERRELEIYLPARFRRTRRYPLLVVHDGSDFVRFAELRTVLDNLIHALEIPGLVVALTQSPNRLHEYADDERHAQFLADELLPALSEEYPLVDDPSARALFGASFGAVASLSAAWRKPGVWGNLGLLSGSFAFTDIGDHDRGPVFDPVVEFVNAFRAAPGRPADKAYLACGTYESLIYYNRSLLPLLQDTGMAVRYAEARDGHNWENWRDRLREALSYLFPGPLWMVYE